MSIRNIICAMLSYVTTIKVCKSFLCSYFFFFCCFCYYFMFIFIYILLPMFCVVFFFSFFFCAINESFSWQFLLVLGKINFIMLQMQYWPSLVCVVLFYSVNFSRSIFICNQFSQQKRIQRPCKPKAVNFNIEKIFR